MLQAKQLLQGRYYLQQSLGQNAGRQTWLAEDRSATPPQPIIVKLLAFSPQMQWDEFKLFEREGQVLKTLNHPKIPKYRDYFSLDQQAGEGLCWFGLVQDYIPGVSLQQWLDEGKRFTEAQVRSIATQVLDILIYLHGLNSCVLHRDIKPSNLIWGADEQVYLVDFGAVHDPTAVEGTTFTVVGTAGYAPLEQFYGKTVPASDLYALGATLIHLLTGIAPADLPQSNLRIQFRDRVSLTPSFIRWIESLTEPDLDRRFSSANLALEALHTGHSYTYPIRTSPQPVGSHIRLKKSMKRLVIKFPRRRISLINFVKFGWQLLLTAGSLIFLLSPSLIAVALVLLILQNSSDFSDIIWWALLGFIVFWVWSFKKISDELKRVFLDLKEALLACLGNHSLDFSLYKFGVYRNLFILAEKCYPMGRVSDIKTIEVIPLEGVIIQTKKKRYVLHQELTESEGDWLVDQIQDWLYSIKNQA